MRRKQRAYLGFRHSAGGVPWRLLLPDAARRGLGLPPGDTLRVRMRPGGVEIPLPVEPHVRGTERGGGPLIPISLERHEGELLLGPLVGILAASQGRSGDFYGFRSNFRDIIRMGRRLGLTVVVLTPEGVTGDRVTAHVHAEQTPTWRRAVLPLPSVVYNRVPTRRDEGRPAVARAKQVLARRGVPLFNPGFFDKRTLYRWMSRSPELAGFLPETEEVKTREQLDAWLALRDLVYVKPIQGRGGVGIIQCRAEGRGYHLTIQRSESYTRRRYRSRAAAVDRVWQRVRGREHLVQQGVPLATYRGRRFDLCVLVQKDRRGRWAVTGAGASVVAKVGGVVTQDGSWATATQALTETFGAERAAELKERACRLGLTVARLLERRVAKTGRLGEISIDVGVDGGRLWLFEANAKPMPFWHPNLRARSLLRLLHYCERLARSR